MAVFLLCLISNMVMVQYSVLFFKYRWCIEYEKPGLRKREICNYSVWFDYALREKWICLIWVSGGIM